ncbi:MAG: hypothetical protein VW397_04225 [Candidatus Margulisiibacteriota bacterium]
MFEVVLGVIVFIVFLLLVRIEIKRYRLRLAHLDRLHQESMKTIESHANNSDTSGIDVQKEQLYRLKKKELQDEINRQSNN